MSCLVTDICSNLPENIIGTAGDFCVDVYWDMLPEAGEKSIETGKMTIPVSPARYAPGGAGNIIANLRGIGLKNIHCFGAAGGDPFGIWLAQELAAENCNTLTQITRKDYHTPVYCKPLLGGVEQSRFDLGNTPLAEKECDEILSDIRKSLGKIKVLIVNGQLSNGLHGEYFRKKFALLVKEYSSKVRFVFDGRDHLDAYCGVTLKINADAASALAFGKSGCDPVSSGRKILSDTGRELVITDGENGCYVFEQESITRIPAVKYDGLIDTVGAGDSFTAGFSCALACGKSMTESAVFGTYCSAVTVRKINQTGTPSQAELIEISKYPLQGERI